jgi:hypothetical protein
LLAFDNSNARIVDEKPVTGNGILRGATGTAGWTWHEIELPVPTGAHNINFGLLFTGTGTAWFDALKIELNGVRYANPRFDLDFESPTTKAAGFFFAGDNGSNQYKVGLDATTAFAGRQSLKMQFTGGRDEPEAASRLTGLALPLLDPAHIDDASRSMEHATAAPIVFVNRSSTAVDIYWIDYEGNRMLFKPALAAGAVWRISTFLTHPWLVVASGTGGTKEHDTGVRIAAFEASASTGGDAVITDK